MSDDGHDTASMVPTRLGTVRVRVVGSGSPAVLWHSLLVDSTTWDRIRPGLAAHRRLILIDGPCHGRSDATTRPFGLGDCAGVACDVLDHLGFGAPVDWVGNAWGGHVGIMFAAAQQERCRSLVAIGTPIGVLPPTERRKMRLFAGLYRLVGPVRPMVKPICDGLLGAHSSPDNATVVVAALRRARRGGMSNAIRSLSVKRPDLTTVLMSVIAPTLLVASTDDDMYRPTEAQAAAEYLANGASASVPGAGRVGSLLHAAPILENLITDFWQDPGGSVQKAG